MKIELKEISVAELVEGYEDNGEEGVFAYNGKLDVRPPFQREFVYNDKQRDAVIDTITKGFPLNVMYWAVKDNGNFEIIDGQQRTISICQYVNGDFAFNKRYFHNLLSDEKSKILKYKLTIYLCTGSASDKLKWFETINIAGEKLYKQELLNAVYSGSFITDAKRYFSKTGCPAYSIGSKYLKGSTIRQDYLETTLKWISNDNIEEYMAQNQHSPNANTLWIYFQSVINWVKVIFPSYRKEMKGIDWGFLYNEFKDKSFDTKKLEEQVTELMLDDEVTKKSGIYSYVLTGKEKYLNLRAFTESQKRQTYEKQKGICPICKDQFKIEQMEADHIIAWHLGGKTDLDNCQMLCITCNRTKGGK